MLAIFTVLLVSMGCLCSGQLLVDKLRMNFIKLEQQMWTFVLWESPTLEYSDLEQYLCTKFLEYDKQLKEMPEEILRGLGPVKQIHSFMYLYPELRQNENLYEKLREFLHGCQNLTKADKTRIDAIIDADDLIRDILNPKSGANATVHKVYDLTFGNENMLFKTVELTDGDYYCKNYFQSPQQVHYNLYNAIALNGLKSYIMLQFSQLMQQINNDKGNYTDVAIIIRNNFERRVNETMTVFRGAMEATPVSITRCDPQLHQKGVTYDEFTRLLQGHIQNEVDMNYDGTCKQNCAAYPASRSYGCYDKDSDYCKYTEKCSGRIVECRFIESHMKICPSWSPSRRYENIVFDSGLTYGKETSCARETVNSWHRWFVHCSYCMCLCDDANIHSDRYINLRPALSDIQNNRVVTGVRLKKENRILHIQVQEGELLPYGYINQSSVHWVPVDDYKITDYHMYEGTDYFKLTYEHRTMTLDDIIIPEDDFVLTGVGFRVVDNQVRLEIYANEINWSQGTVDKGSSTVYYSHGQAWNKVNMGPDVNIPTLARTSTTTKGQHMYVQFTHTGFKADAAQTTIPFIDIQPVYNEPAVPLKGAGIQYRGAYGYGGFVQPSILTYDYSELLLARFPTFNLNPPNSVNVEIN